LTCHASILGKGAALFTILPAECFVGYQLAPPRSCGLGLLHHGGRLWGWRTRLCPHGPMLAGRLTEDDYCWVPPMTETAILRAVQEAFGGR